MRSLGILAAFAIGAIALDACSSSSSGGGEAQSENVERTTSPIVMKPVTRSAAIANAEEWVAAKLQYCQAPNGKADPDTLCAATCSRESNPAWDPYRSDCSGLISWAWDLAAPGLVTDEFAPFATTASKTIDCAAMQAGDAANRNAVGHIVLFKEWITPGAKAVFIEEPGCDAVEPYARELESDVECDGGTVNIVAEKAAFTAIRYDAIVDDPDAGASDEGGAAHDAGSIAPIDASSGSNGVDAGTGCVGAECDAPPSEIETPHGVSASSGCSASGSRRSAPGAAGWIAAFVALAFARRREDRKRRQSA